MTYHLMPERILLDWKLFHWPYSSWFRKFAWRIYVEIEDSFPSNHCWHTYEHIHSHTWCKKTLPNPSSWPSFVLLPNNGRMLLSAMALWTMPSTTSCGILPRFVGFVQSTAATATALMNFRNTTKMLVRSIDASFMFHRAVEGCWEELAPICVIWIIVSHSPLFKLNCAHMLTRQKQANMS